MGFSPVGTVYHCVQAMPPSTHHDLEPVTVCLVERGKGPSPWCFRWRWILARRAGRNVTPPELSPPGPFVAGGCPPTLAAYPSSAGEFERRLPHGYGPARVGLRLGLWRAPRRHRLRLSLRYLRLTQWVRWRLEATTSPLPRGGQFPLLTEVPLSGIGRRHRECPVRGVGHRPVTGGGQKDARLISPIRTRCWLRTR